LKHFFATGAYERTKLMDKATFLDFIIEIVRRTDNEPAFNVRPRRWVVERTFGWMTRWRRLVRDYETRLDVSEAMIHVASRERRRSACPPSRRSRDGTNLSAHFYPTLNVTENDVISGVRALEVGLRAI
jgi:hypothetical protein